jgi:hypothetical protein
MVFCGRQPVPNQTGGRKAVLCNWIDFANADANIAWLLRVRHKTFKQGKARLTLLGAKEYGGGTVVDEFRMRKL